MKPVVTTVRLNAQSFQRLKERARQEDRTVSSMVRHVVEEYLRRPKKRAT